jgi:hypothetical protein
VFLANRLLTDVPFRNLLRDPGHVTNTSPVIGALTFVGWFGWTALAVLLLTAAWLRGRSAGNERRAAFLVATGILAVGALADDAFQLHEVVFVEFTGVHENGWYLVYLAAVVTWAMLFRDQLWPPGLELGVAAALLAVSQVMEVLPRDLVIWEESLKLLGIGWLVAFATREVRSAADGLATSSGDERSSSLTTAVPSDATSK